MTDDVTIAERTLAGKCVCPGWDEEGDTEHLLKCVFHTGGWIYCPYIPLQVTGVDLPVDEPVKITFKTRYN